MLNGYGRKGIKLVGRKLEGLQKGKVEGMHEQAIKIALRMLEQGFEREIVLATTQLTDADIPNCY